MTNACEDFKRKVILYIAVSLDGYIADADGKVGWLGGENPDYAGDYGYSDFIKNIDTIVMGKKTYRQIVTELSPDEWVYSGMKSYVATHHPQEDTDEILFTAEPVTELVKRLKKEPGKDIWICGGADVANQLMEADEIDEYHLTIMPVILGSGIRLFAEKSREISLRLLKSSSENGVLDCVYGKAI